MTTADHAAPAPISLRADEGEAIWFLGTLATIKASGDTTAGRLALIEQLAPQGSGSPLHRHEREDEWFYVLDGELTFWVGGEVIVASAGSFVYGPRDVPHTFVVSSEAGAHFLLGAEPAGLDAFVREVGEPATERTLPPAGGGPPDPERLGVIAARYGIEILGPPGIPE